MTQRQVNYTTTVVTLNEGRPAPAPAAESFSLIDAILQAGDAPKDSGGRLDSFLNDPSPARALVSWLGSDFPVGDDLKGEVSRRLGRDIATIDELLNRQVNAILHHPKFQKLEASWRGLRYLVEQTPQDENIQILVLNVTFDELKRDLLNALEFDQSVTFRKVFSEHFDTPGMPPIGALIGDYEFTNHPEHIDVLREMSSVAAAGFSPFITAAHPALLTLDRFSDLVERPFNLARVLEDTQSVSHAKWRALRKREDSRFVALTLPRVLFRAPYRDDSHRVDKFHFTEEVGLPDRSDHLWGNAAYAYGGVLVRTFARCGWLADIRGSRRDEETGGLVTGLPLCSFGTDRRGLVPRTSTEIVITDALDKELSDLGFLPLCWCQDTEYSVFSGSQSIQSPKTYNEITATVNARISSMLQYMFCASRFAHYLKVRVREKVGSMVLAHEFQEELRQWLVEYTNGSPNPSAESKARWPLREAEVVISDVPGQPGRFNCEIYLRPQFQLDQLSGTIRLSTQLVANVR